ncbi:MAG: deoxyribonuclease IV [Firmicutes bacterium]|nr:deoxyribonuclease IV [Bacillota bacterium]
MLRIGPHISASHGYLAMGRHALDLGANAFAFFTRNPRGGSARQMDEEDVLAYRDLAAARGVGPIVAHAAYTMNPAAEKEHLRAFTREAMADDLARMAHTPGNLYNFHPGSHVGQGVEAGIDYIAALLNGILTAGQPTTVLLETMTGKGSEIGGRFEELRGILDRVRLENKLGVCLDTCHVWDAGYDIAGDLDGVLTEFDRVIGLSRLCAVHLNDSMNARGSRKDRHARLGEGAIGWEAIERIVNHAALKGVPFILETPNEDEGWMREIRMVREAYKG